MIQDIISAAFIIVGSIFMLISSIGMIRFPDFYIRNSASTKAVVLGVLLVLLGVGIHYNDIMIFIEIFAIIFFIFLISPLSAHIISRAAVITGVKFWEKTLLKDLERYKKERKESEGDAEDWTQEKDLCMGTPLARFFAKSLFNTSGGFVAGKTPTMEMRFAKIPYAT